MMVAMTVGVFVASPNATAEFAWQNAAPESQGVSPTILASIQQRLAAKKTRAFLVIRHDRIIHEWYAPGQSATNRQGTASLAKALIGGLSLAVALTDGTIALDDRAATFIPQWKDDPRKSRITIRQLGSHTSGLDDAEQDGLPHDRLTGWKGDFWKRPPPSRDPFTLARDEARAIYEPGRQLQYSNPGIGLMTYCVTATLRHSPSRDIRSLLRERVMQPVGVTDAEWSAGYGQTYTVDGLPLVCSWGGATFTPRAAARLGRMVLREGKWEGRPILSPRAVREVTTDAGLPGNCGMGWWGNGGGRYTGLPRDAVWGAGAGDQLLLVIPSLDLIMVRNGETLTPGPDEPPVRDDDVFTKYHDYRARILFEPLAGAVIDQAGSPAPFPESPHIGGLRWAPVETIERRAQGSDNWPVTWADDDALYTAYGDGRGFEPFTPEKLSLGFAKIEGMPPDFQGRNIPAPSLQAAGDGAKGPKASGLLCADGILYLWTRNVGNAQLAWSTDHGATWSRAAWRLTNSFGCPSFLNFGKNNADARDTFSYTYSPDSDSAYERSDRLVLARAPTARLPDRDAWEFFAGMNASGQPTWSRNISERRGVFENAGRCGRTSVVWNGPLRRYLLVQPLPGLAPGTPEAPGRAAPMDTRFSGGLAVYDAPEPWGPWTTVYSTNRWAVGPGESASFPTKWISTDGLTLHLVFSGDDTFAVRAARLIPKSN